jgi:hypothetical protein
MFNERTSSADPAEKCGADGADGAGGVEHWRLEAHLEVEMASHTGASPDKLRRRGGSLRACELVSL